MQQKQHSQLSLDHSRQRSQIVATNDGKLYQISEVTPAQLRRQRDFQRNQAANQVAYLFLGIGAAFVGLIALMIFGSILVAATRPAPPPEVKVNPRCVLFCGGNGQ